MPAPFVKWVMIKSSKDMVNAIKKPDKMPGKMSGNTTLKNAYTGDAPRSSAASKVLGFSCLNLGITFNITYGILNVIWASSIVLKPNLKPKLINKSMRDIPVTISAFSIGIFVIPSKTAFVLLCIRLRAMQVMVPIIVAANADISAINSVLYKASIIV